MRQPRDYDAELRAITERAKQLQERKLRQLGELVVATGADALPLEQLTGALLAAVKAEPAAKEGWRGSGVAFFQRSKRKAAPALGAVSAGRPAGGGDPSAPTS